MMDYVGQLARVVASGQRKQQDKLAVGRYSGGSIVINGRHYRPTWGGDFDCIDGQQVRCIVENNNCVVMSVE